MKKAIQVFSLSESELHHFAEQCNTNFRKVGNILCFMPFWLMIGFMGTLYFQVVGETCNDQQLYGNKEQIQRQLRNAKGLTEDRDNTL